MNIYIYCFVFHLISNLPYNCQMYKCEKIINLLGALCLGLRFPLPFGWCLPLCLGMCLCLPPCNLNLILFPCQTIHAHPRSIKNILLIYLHNDQLSWKNHIFIPIRWIEKSRFLPACFPCPRVILYLCPLKTVNPKK